MENTSESIRPDNSPTPEHIAKQLSCDMAICTCGRLVGREWRTHCPAHEDKHPSLFVSEAARKLLVNCRAGCSQELVISALRRRGLWPSSLGNESIGVILAQLAEAKGLALPFLKDLGWRDGRWHDTPAVVIPYPDQDGLNLFNRYRTRLSGPDHYRQPKGTKLAPYGLNRLAFARDAGLIVLVEGETDWATLTLGEIPCLALPGANAWREAYSSLLSGLDVVVWQEPGQGGEKFILSIIQDIPNARIIPAPSEAKDPNELFLVMDRNIPAFQQRMRDLISSAIPSQDIRRMAESQEAQVCWEKARPLLIGDILASVRQTMREGGFAGDLCAPILAYLALTSRLLPRPLNLAFIAQSASGKNRAVDAALELVPESAYHLEKAGSARALIYNENVDYRHKTVVVAEADSIPEDGSAAAAIRSLASDNQMEYDVVEKDAQTGRHTTRHITKPGPTGLITTSTRHLGPQMSTRTLSVGIPDSPNQTRAILLSQARQLNQTSTSTDTSELIAAQRWLELAGERRVVVAFAGALAELVPVEQVRMRRDFPQLLTVIQAVALLYQRQRDRDQDGRVVAILEDYRIAHDLLLETFTSAATGGVTTVVRETVKAAAAISSADKPVTVKQVGDHLGLPRNTVWYRVQQALSLGYLVNQESRKNHPAQLVLGESLPDYKSALPTVEELAAAQRGPLGRAGPVEVPSPDLSSSMDEQEESVWLAVQRFNENPEDIETSASVDPPPPHVCGACGSNNWWQRPPYAGGGWVCGLCHPDPRTLSMRRS